MLLVEDDEPEPGELDGRGQRGVRPDHEIHAAAGDRAPHGGRLRRGPPAGEELETEPRTLEPRRQRRVVLRRQGVGGSDEESLMSGRDRGEQRARGDGGLAAADVPEQEAPHRDRLLQVGEDLGERRVLARSERERNPLADARPNRGRCRERRSGARRRGARGPRDQRL